MNNILIVFSYIFMLKSPIIFDSFASVLIEEKVLFRIYRKLFWLGDR